MCGKDKTEKLDKSFMRGAIKKATEGIKNGESPFGALIVKDEKVVSSEHNKVFGETDITSHAEINAIRKACKKLKSIKLKGCIIYSTTEPCPMCFSAIHWAGISKIVFGTKIKDSKKAGFDEINISNTKMKKEGKLNITIISGVLRKENLELFKMWEKLNKKKTGLY